MPLRIEGSARRAARTAPRSGAVRGGLVLSALLLFGGCDRDTADLVQEIGAARGDCTEEKLKAGAEECVQMFERYAEMGGEALETYVGAMRALDQALQRSGGLPLDTFGLGRALTPSEGAGEGGWGDQRYLDGTLSGQGAYLYDPAGVRGGAARGYQGSAPAAAWGERGEAPAVSPPVPPTAAGRGVLLPPDQRLWRPWLEEGGARSGEDLRPGQSGGWGAPEYTDPRYADPRYVDPRFLDPRYSDPRYANPYYADPRYVDPRYADPRYLDPRYADPRYLDPRYADPRYADPRYVDPRALDPRYADPRGLDPRYADPRADPRSGVRR